MHGGVRSWRSSGVMIDKTHCDRRSNHDWQDYLLALVDEYLVGFLLKYKVVVEYVLSRKFPWTSSGGGTGDFLSRSWSKGEWTDGKNTLEFCSQLGANDRFRKIMTRNFVQVTLKNLIIRQL